MICPSATYGFILWDVLLVKGDGTANTRISLPSIASGNEVVNIISSGNLTPGSLSLCSCSVFSILISSSRMDHTVISCPLLCNRTDKAIPQLPAPMIPIFAICITSCLFILRFSWINKSYALFNKYNSAEYSSDECSDLVSEGCKIFMDWVDLTSAVMEVKVDAELRDLFES